MTNLVELERRGLISDDLPSCLREANGLRNRIVHSYNALSDELALRSIRLLLPKLEMVREVMERWV